MVFTNWREAVIRPDTTIEQALIHIDKTGLKAAVVVDNEDKLMGIVTDGDIRRGIIRHVSLKAPVSEILNPNPSVLKSNSSLTEKMRIMQALNQLVMPVVDESRKVVGLEFISNLFNTSKYDNPVFLMAGGFGKRLQPFTDNCPKPLLRIGGKPILESILENFINAGFKNFYISVHYLPEKIINHFGDGAKWGVEIKYVHEVNPLGTGGALGLLPGNLPDLPLIMMNGDILTNIDVESLLQFHNESKSVATMCVREYDLQVPYGVVERKDDKVNKIVEKPVHQFFVNAGIYVLEPRLFKNVKKNEHMDMPNLLNQYIDQKEKVSLYPIHEYWLDVGQKNDFERAQLEFDEIFRRKERP